jgi:hypothetical protein
VAEFLTYGVAIAGYGPDADQTKQYMIVGRAPAFAPSGFEYAELLAKMPGSTGQEIQWPGGMSTQGSFTAEFGIDEYSTAGQELRAFLTSTRPRSWGFLDEHITSVETALRFEAFPGEDVPVAGEYIYLAREKMYVSSVGAASDLDSDGKNELPVTVVRGVHGTMAKSLDGTRAQEDKAAFPAPQFVEGREAILYEITGTTSATATPIMRGVIEEPKSDEELLTFRVPVRDALARIQGKRLGASRFRFAAGLKKTAYGVVRATSPEPLASEYQDSQPVYDTTNAAYFMMCRIGDIILPMKVVRTYEDGILHGSYTIVPFPSYPVAGDPYGIQHMSDTNKGEPDKKIGWEVLVTVPGYSYFVDDAGSESSHIADVLRCIFCSTGEMTWNSGGRTLGSNGDFDALPGTWGLGIQDDWIDHDSFERIKNWGFPYSSLNLDNLVIGNDKDIPLAKDIINDLLEGSGLSLTVGVSGKIMLVALFDDGRDALTSISEANMVDGTFYQEHSYWKPMHNLTVRTFRQWPGSDHSHILRHTDINGHVQRRFEGIVEDVDIDASHYGVMNKQRSKLSYDTARALKAIHRYQYKLRTEPLPVYGWQHEPGTTKFNVGSRLNISHAAAIDPDGTRGITSHVAVVISREVDTDSGCFSYVVIDLHYLSRTRRKVSLSGKVTDTPGAPTGTSAYIEKFEYSKDGDPDAPNGDWGIWDDETPEDEPLQLLTSEGVSRGANAIWTLSQ